MSIHFCIFILIFSFILWFMCLYFIICLYFILFSVYFFCHANGFSQYARITYPVTGFLLIFSTKIPRQKKCLEIDLFFCLGISEVYSTNSSWYFTYFRKFNNCYIWLSNSSQTLENTKFVASELSLTLSLVLHFPIAFHEP